MNDTFMKERPVLPLLLSMALPNVISMLVNSLYNIVDSLFVARISEDAMTALSLVFPIQNFSNAIAIGFGIGINAMIALYLGAGDREKAEIAATHGFVLSLVHGVVMMAVGWNYATTLGGRGFYVSMPWLSRFWMYFPVPLAGVAMIIFEIEALYNHIKSIFVKEEV